MCIRDSYTCGEFKYDYIKHINTYTSKGWFQYNCLFYIQNLSTKGLLFSNDDVSIRLDSIKSWNLNYFSSSKIDKSFKGDIPGNNKINNQLIETMRGGNYHDAFYPEADIWKKWIINHKLIYISKTDYHYIPNNFLESFKKFILYFNKVKFQYVFATFIEMYKNGTNINLLNGGYLWDNKRQCKNWVLFMNNQYTHIHGLKLTKDCERKLYYEFTKIQ